MDGFRLVRQRGLRQYVIIPALINMFVFITMIALSVSQFELWVTSAVAWLPDWLSFLSWLIWLLSVILVVFVLFFTFTIIANIIASPFNALLSVKVEEHILGAKLTSTTSLLLILPRALGREVVKFLYFVPRLVGLLLLSVIPVVNVIAPIAWIMFSAWVMAIQYTDYAADNNDTSFRELRRRLGEVPLQSLLFGIPAYFLLAIPLVNLVLMPVAVASGTVFWVKNLRQVDLNN